MNTTGYKNRIPMPPAFMATTRQKILLGEHYIPESPFAITHPRTAHALETVGHFTREVINFAKQF